MSGARRGSSPRDIMIRNTFRDQSESVNVLEPSLRSSRAASLRLRRFSLRMPIALLLLLSCSAGCVERRYTIRTDPPGALIYVNGEEIGSSPVSKSFTYYGDRNITMVHDGSQTTRLVQPIPAPWWDNIATEFVSENLIPYRFRDEREFRYKLAPEVNPPQGDVMRRAESLRDQARRPIPPKPPGFWSFLGFD